MTSGCRLQQLDDDRRREMRLLHCVPGGGGGYPDQAKVATVRAAATRAASMAVVGEGLWSAKVRGRSLFVYCSDRATPRTTSTYPGYSTPQRSQPLASKQSQAKYHQKHQQRPRRPPQIGKVNNRQHLPGRLDRHALVGRHLYGCFFEDHKPPRSWAFACQLQQLLLSGSYCRHSDSAAVNELG
jgi:hypothetical protein